METNVQPLTPPAPGSEISLVAFEEDLNKHIQSTPSAIEGQSSSPGPKNGLEIILQTAEKLRERKSKAIRFADPILRLGDQPIIFPNTINVIQGQAGVHKSRLAETICSVVLRKEDYDGDFLGLVRNVNLAYRVCYVDTERNLTEQFPYALQQIQLHAGFQIEEHPIHFCYVSLLQLPRTDRFSVLAQFLEKVRREQASHILVVLDVLTDCLMDFNRADESMALVDLLNQTVNEHDVTFICVIHENPAQMKARGHLGTEIFNKATTVIQVSMDIQREDSVSDLVKIRFLKSRLTRKADTFFARFCQEQKRLVLASADQIKANKEATRKKANTAEIIEFIEDELATMFPMPKKNFFQKLKTQFEMAERTLDERIAEIIEQKISILKDGIPHQLTKQSAYRVVYSLSPEEGAKDNE